MLKENVRKGIILSAYFVAVITVITSVFFIQQSLTNKSENGNRNYIYVMDDIVGKDIPVVGQNQVMLKPYTNDKVKIVKSFYDYLGTKEKQEQSLIYHEGTYIQNSGIDFGGVNNFDVVAVLDGTVIDVKEDVLLGKVVQIRHSNELISVYQSLSQVTVKKDDVVSRNQIIGKSGLSNIAKDLNDHLHFELYDKGQIVNPAEYFDKKVQ
jgi:stage II sporulation protein Q